MVRLPRNEEQPYLDECSRPGGGTRYVKVMGRLRGIDPPFSRHWEKI